MLTAWLQEHCFILITKAFRGERGWQNWWLTRSLAWINKHFFVKQCLGVSRRGQMVLSLSEWIAAVQHAEALISYWLLGAESNHLRLMLFSYCVKLGMTQFFWVKEWGKDEICSPTVKSGDMNSFPCCVMYPEAAGWEMQDWEMCLALSHTSEHPAGFWLAQPKK